MFKIQIGEHGIVIDDRFAQCPIGLPRKRRKSFTRGLGRRNREDEAAILGKKMEGGTGFRSPSVG